MKIGEKRTETAEEGLIKDSSPTTTVTQACAACKFQRRKCSADCPLAPYFPAHRLQDFQNVRRLFGVKNVLKTLGDVEPAKRSTAAECMILEANCRANDLAGGCYKVIAKLQSEITHLEAQRHLVLCHLRIYREAAALDSAGSHGGAAVVGSEFYGIDFDGRLGLSSLLLDRGGSMINLGNFDSLNGSGLLIKEEDGTSLSCRTR